MTINYLPPVIFSINKLDYKKNIYFFKKLDGLDLREGLRTKVPWFY